MNRLFLTMLFWLCGNVLAFPGVIEDDYARHIWKSSKSFEEIGGITVADTDLDGKLEIIINEKKRVIILEQIDLRGTIDFIKVWESPVLGSRVAGRICIADSDLDDNLEIIVFDNSPGDFYIFENIADNLWVKVFQQHVRFDVDSLTISDADFDGQQEIIVGAKHSIQIYENTGDNAYSKVWGCDLPFFNVNGVAVHDLDND